MLTFTRKIPAGRFYMLYYSNKTYKVLVDNTNNVFIENHLGKSISEVYNRGIYDYVRRELNINVSKVG